MQLVPAEYDRLFHVEPRDIYATLEKVILREFFGVTDYAEFRSLGNGVRKNGVLNRCPYAGSILKFRIGFSPWFSAAASHLRLSFLLGFGAIEAVDTEFPYRVPIVDRGAIAVPLLPTPFPILRELSQWPGKKLFGIFIG